MELRQRLQADSLAQVIRKNRLKWFGHVERKADDDWVKACQRFEVLIVEVKVGGKKIWRECVAEDIRLFGAGQYYNTVGVDILYLDQRSVMCRIELNGKTE